MSIDMTNELKDLFDIYGKGAEHFRNEEKAILPILVAYMKEFCNAYDKRTDMECKFQILQEKLATIDDEEDE